MKLNFLYKNEIIKIYNLFAKYDNINIENGKIDIFNNKRTTNLKLNSKIIFQNDQEKIPIINKKFNKGDTFLLKVIFNQKK